MDRYRGRPAENVQKRSFAWVLFSIVLLIACAILYSTGLMDYLLRRYNAVQFSKEVSTDYLVQSKVEGIYLDYLNQPCGIGILSVLIETLENNARHDIATSIGASALKNCSLDQAASWKIATKVLMLAATSGDQSARRVAVAVLERDFPNELQTKIESAVLHHDNQQYDVAAEKFYELFSVAPPNKLGVALYKDYHETLVALGKYCQAADLYSVMLMHNEIVDAYIAQDAIEKAEKQGQCSVSSAQEEKPILLSLSDQNSFMIDVVINGVKGVFLVDTGASITALSNEYARAAKLASAESSIIIVNGVGGVANARLTTVDEAKVGTFSVSRFDVAVMEEPSALLGYDGLIGMNVLSRFKIKIAANLLELSVK